MKKLIIVLIALTLSLSAYAFDTAGIEFQPVFKAGDHSLVLNGAGLRKKFFIKVYAGGLYLPEKATDAAAILDANTSAAIRMVMIYDGVSAKKLQDTWQEGFEDNVADLAPLQDRINDFKAFFTETSKKNDEFDIVYTPEKGTELIINGQSKGFIPGADFRKAILSLWLGKKPADKKLKKAMLGGK